MAKTSTKTEQQQNNEARGKLPSHGVFVIEGEGDNAFWTKVGAAWEHGDGEGFNVTLTAVPLTGRLVLRRRKAGE